MNEQEISIKRFNLWADDMIFNLEFTAEHPFFSDSLRFEARGGIKWLELAKINLKRLAEEEK